MAAILMTVGCASHPVKESSGEVGLASYYARSFDGHKTASGELYDPKELTAAHPKLPFGTRVLVVNKSNGRSVEVRINDRGPYAGSRIIDLSQAAARVLGLLHDGITQVELRVLSAH